MKRFMGLLIPALLAGCQSPACPAPVHESALAATSSADTIHNTTQQLYQNGSLNQKAPVYPGSIPANSDRVSLDWEGDAVELLSQLARQRGLGFAYDGVRLPVPVSLHVSNITFEELLRNLDMQIGWRAVLKQQPLELHLYFALPDKGGRLA